VNGTKPTPPPPPCKFPPCRQAGGGQL
jgi:hypothetical protein